MNFGLFIILFLVTFAITSINTDNCDTKAKIVCYFSSWAYYREEDGQFTTDNIDPNLCTHIIYSFAGLDLNLEIASLDPNVDVSKGGYRNVTSLKENYPCTKIMLAIGGWNEGSIKYSVMASADESRKKFVNSALRFISYYNFDGLDLDWEYPTSRGGIDADKENLVILLRELQAAFSPWGFLISMAVGMIPSYYSIGEIAKYVDYVYLMGYDLVQSDSNVTGLLAPFTPIKDVLNTWIKEGFPASKLILGIATYGRCFNLADPKDHEVGAPTTTTTCGGAYTNVDSFLAFYEIQLLVQNGFCEGTTMQDENMYSWCDNEWITYDNEQTIALKTQYVLDNNLGGVMVWSLDTDDFLGIYGKKYTLLSVIDNIINNSK